MSSIKKTLTVSLSNFLAAGSIVAGGMGVKLWELHLGISQGERVLLDVVSANFLGAAIGAIFGGFLADKYGRKGVFTYNTLVFMIGCLLLGTATSYAQLFVGYLVTGIAAGASVPASWSYICEESESEHRGRNIAISQAAWGLGPAVILLLSTLMAPGGVCFDWVISVADFFNVRANHTNAVNVYASRLVFGFLFLVGYLTWMLQRQLNESEDYLKEQKEQHDHTLWAPWNGFCEKKRNFKALGILVCMYLSWNLVASTMGSLQNYLYETTGNLSTLVSNGITSGQWFLTVILTIIGAFFVDKYDHRKLLVGFVGAGILAWLIVLFVGIDSMLSLSIVTFFWAAQAGISVQFFFALWGVELFPTRYRAFAIGLMFCIVRALSSLGVVSFSFLYNGTSTGFYSSSIAMVILLALSAWIGWRWAFTTRGLSLEDIKHNRYGEDYN